MKPGALCVALAAAAVAAGAGCPRLPPPPPRPSVALERLDRAAASGEANGWLRARLRVHNRGAFALVLTAVDWELAAADRALLRGRWPARLRFAPDQRAAVDVAIAVPAALDAELRGRAASGELRLRGTVHLEDARGVGAPAPFDEAAALP